MLPPCPAGARGLAQYRIYLKNNDEQIITHANADCASDREACMVAESLIEPGEQVEVWNGLRRVWPVGLSIASDRFRFINWSLRGASLRHGRDDPANELIAAACKQDT